MDSTSRSESPSSYGASFPQRHTWDMNPSHYNVQSLHDYGDGSDEWEYEYSANETEIYYVTLDLSLPVKVGPDRGFRLPKPRKKDAAKKKKKKEDDNSDDDDEEDEDEDEEAAEDDAQRERSQEEDDDVDEGQDVDSEKEDMLTLLKKVKKGEEGRTIWKNKGISHGPGEGKGQAKRKRGGGIHLPPEAPDDGDDDPADPPLERPRSLKIAGLHTPTPLVSYDNNIYQLSWRQNIGTEFLFTDRDNIDPIPIVRQLPDDVDLVAVSSVRLTSKRIGSAPLPEDERAGMKPDFIKHYHTIPKTILTSAARKRAAPFLERLANIKRAKMETDQVSVLARPPEAKQMATWIGTLKRKRGMEKERLEGGLESTMDKAEREAKIARIAEIDADVLKVPEKIKQPNCAPNVARKPAEPLSGRPRGRPKKSAIKILTNDAPRGVPRKANNRQDTEAFDSVALDGTNGQTPDGVSVGGFAEFMESINRDDSLAAEDNGESGSYSTPLGIGLEEDNDIPFEHDHDAPFELDDVY
ncbi:hypothetical protein BJ878DRAFT_538802 [Calycina marina]|uniref:Transcription factor TFIIIC triple barrel domain-containing protein n=1 Tax=Calycina marina TaxID=1763456 RepID=A0A9P7Z9S5_9HELO|nr:hypothetical protein BJ878DRAFT_538802 [Calycina marina]